MFRVAIVALIVLARPLYPQAVIGTVLVSGEADDAPPPSGYVVRVSVESPDFGALVSAVCSDDRAAYRASLGYVERTREEVVTTRELRSLLDDGLVVEELVDSSGQFRIDSLIPRRYVVWGDQPPESELSFQVLATVDYVGERQELALYHNRRVHVLAAVCSMKH